MELEEAIEDVKEAKLILLCNNVIELIVVITEGKKQGLFKNKFWDLENDEELDLSKLKNIAIEPVLKELDMQIEHNKELEATLKQTQDSWFEDTQKLEQEKEKNRELEKNNIDLKEKNRLTAENLSRSYISKDKIKAIVDEHIPKQPNIITGKMEYAPNTNANSFLVQDILELLEGK